MSFQSSVQYCRDIVMKHDRDHYLASLFLPEPLRPISWGLRAFNHELATIRDTVREDLLGRMRFQFWRDSIEKIHQGTPPQQPIAIVLAAGVHRHGLSAHRLKRIVNGREENFMVRQYATLKDLEEYSESTASQSIYLHLDLLGVKSLDIDHIASHVGKAAGIATLLRGTPFHLRSRTLYIPSQVCAKHSVVTEAVIRHGPSHELENAVFEVATLANDHLITARTHIKETPLDKTAFKAFLPAVATVRWLHALERANFNLFDSRVHQLDALLPLAMWKARFTRTL